MTVVIDMSKYRNCGTSLDYGRIKVLPHVTLWSRGAHNTLGRYFVAATVEGEVVASQDWSTSGSAYQGGYRAFKSQLEKLGLLA